MAAGAVGQGFELRLGHRIGRRPQLFQQSLDGRFGVGHFGGQAHFSPVGVAEAASLLAPQAEDALDQRPVVELTAVLAGGTAHMGPVHLLAQITSAAVLEERGVAGHVQP